MLILAGSLYVCKAVEVKENSVSALPAAQRSYLLARPFTNLLKIADGAHRGFFHAHFPNCSEKFNPSERTQSLTDH
jgi:hypothetical protein